MSEIFQSTKALSVYNALSHSKRDMSRADVTAFLQMAFDPSVSIDYIDQGAEYLLVNRLAEEAAGVMRIERLPNGFGRKIVRSADSRELLRGDV